MSSPVEAGSPSKSVPPGRGNWQSRSTKMGVGQPRS